MKKVIKINENDIKGIIKKVIKESGAQWGDYEDYGVDADYGDEEGYSIPVYDYPDFYKQEYNHRKNLMTDRKYALKHADKYDPIKKGQHILNTRLNSHYDWDNEYRTDGRKYAGYHTNSSWKENNGQNFEGGPYELYNFGYNPEERWDDTYLDTEFNNEKFWKKNPENKNSARSYKNALKQADKRPLHRKGSLNRAFDESKKHTIKHIVESVIRKLRQN